VRAIPPRPDRPQHVSDAIADILRELAVLRLPALPAILA
jgi:hypothetical protein